MSIFILHINDIVSGKILSVLPFFDLENAKEAAKNWLPVQEPPVLDWSEMHNHTLSYKASDKCLCHYEIFQRTLN